MTELRRDAHICSVSKTQRQIWRIITIYWEFPKALRKTRSSELFASSRTSTIRIRAAVMRKNSKRSTRPIRCFPTRKNAESTINLARRTAGMEGGRDRDTADLISADSRLKAGKVLISLGQVSKIFFSICLAEADAHVVGRELVRISR